MRRFEYITNNRPRLYGLSAGLVIGRLILDYDRLHFTTWNQTLTTLAFMGRTAIGSLLGSTGAVLVIFAVQFGLNKWTRARELRIESKALTIVSTTNSSGITSN